VDPLASSSRFFDPQFIGARHYKVATDVQKILQRTGASGTIIAILGMTAFGRRQEDLSDARVVCSASRRSRFAVARTVSPAFGRHREARGHDLVVRAPRGRRIRHLRNSRFFMAGGIDDVVENAKKLQG